MKFSLNESQAQIRELANKILQDQVTEERLRELDARDVGERFDRDVWQQLATAGLLGIAVDEAYGPDEPEDEGYEPIFRKIESLASKIKGVGTD